MVTAQPTSHTRLQSAGCCPGCPHLTHGFLTARVPPLHPGGSPRCRAAPASRGCRSSLPVGAGPLGQGCCRGDSGAGGTPSSHLRAQCACFSRPLHSPSPGSGVSGLEPQKVTQLLSSGQTGTGGGSMLAVPRGAGGQDGLPAAGGDRPSCASTSWARGPAGVGRRRPLMVWPWGRGFWPRCSSPGRSPGPVLGT